MYRYYGGLLSLVIFFNYYCFNIIFIIIFQGSGEDTEGLCDIIEAIAEVIKLTDPSLLYLEVSTLVSKYPDIR